MHDTETHILPLFQPEPEHWLPTVKSLKNMVIGNNKQKWFVVSRDVVPRLLEFMLEEQIDIELKLEAAVMLGSLTKGAEENVRSIIEAGAVSVLLKDMSHADRRYGEACLRCLRSIFTSEAAPTDIVYQEPTILPQMMSVIAWSPCTQECVTAILGHCCKTPDQQAILCSNGAIASLAPLLRSHMSRVQMPTLRCFAAMCYGNQQVSMAVATATYNGEPIPEVMATLLQRDQSNEMQMVAAKCLTYIYRAGTLDSSDPIISHKALPALVRMCKRDKTWEERVEAAEVMAYLIEVDTNLQRIAAISDHIITTLAEYFKYPGSPPDSNLMPVRKDDITCGNELRQAAFRAYASLGANDEDIRKRIIETENLMEHIVNGLSDPVTKVQLAAVRCMHSLSRSVQQLRTSFQDHCVWKPLMKILASAPDEVLIVASSTLCNLLLKFSPSKEPIVGSGAIELLVGLTGRDDPALKLNGIWALMNMAFQSEQKIKTQILSCLSPDQLFRLLSDPDIQVLMKTLGLLRNLLSNKPHIDHIMHHHGNQIMQAVILILEADHPVEVKEQALCILANVADGDTAKDYIMGNEDMLKKLMSYMMHASVKLQIAATFCISNLIWNQEEGALERQTRLRELGVQKLLQQLISTNNPTLFEKVKTALQQF